MLFLSQKKCWFSL